MQEIELSRFRVGDIAIRQSDEDVKPSGLLDFL